MADKAGRVIFIGNIPYGLTEEQIVHIFSSAGQVLNFRLVYDSDTGRPKGYGFCEFADADTAGSAVRNLNGHEIMGRELRVDFSHVGGKEGDSSMQTRVNGQVSDNMNAAMPPVAGINQGQQQGSTLPALPKGADLPAGVTCPDAISKTLSSLPPAQLLDILTQMKGLVMGDPSKAIELLRQAPQLAYAIFQALLLMGLVDTAVLASVVEVSNTQQTQPQSTPVPQADSSFRPPQNVMSQIPPQQGSQAQPPQHIHQQAQQQAPSGYGQPGMYGNPGPGLVAQPTHHQVPSNGSMPSQEELIKQVLAMTQEQIDQLPPTERSQIMALRSSLGGR